MQSLKKQKYIDEFREAQSTGLTPEAEGGERHALKQKKKVHAGIITKTLDAQISKRQQYVEAERKKNLDVETKMLEENERYMETRKSQHKEWKEKAKRTFDQDLERQRLLRSMQAPL